MGHTGTIGRAARDESLFWFPLSFHLSVHPLFCRILFCVTLFIGSILVFVPDIVYALSCRPAALVDIKIIIIIKKKNRSGIFGKVPAARHVRDHEDEEEEEGVRLSRRVRCLGCRYRGGRLGEEIRGSGARETGTRSNCQRMRVHG